MAFLIFVIGVLIAIVLIVSSVVHFRNVSHSFVRVVAPGTTTVRLNDSGTYTIYYEYEGVVDGQTYSADETPPNMVVEITSVATGAMVDVQSADSGAYSLDSRSGIAVMSFTIDTPGQYQIATHYSDGSSSGEVVLAIGHGIARNIVWGVGSILGSIGVFCGTTFFAFLLTVIVFIMRQRRPTVVVPPAV